MKVLRYFCVGGTAAAVDIGIFFLFAKLLGLNYLWVGATGFVLATWVNYALSIRFVFESGARFNKGAEVVLVYVVSMMGLVINQVTLYGLIDMAQVEMMASKIGATLTVFLWNYISRNYFVFAQHREPIRV